MSQIESKLKELGYELPVIPASKGIYKKTVLAGGLLYVSGHISVNTDGSAIKGKVGVDLTDEQGYAAARQCGLAILSTLKEQLGDLDKVKRLVKLLGMVNARPDYTDHASIMNGCSQLFKDVMGEESGVGVRSAVGMGSLPVNVAVEVEAIFELK